MKNKFEQAWTYINLYKSVQNKFDKLEQVWTLNDVYTFPN